MRFSIISLTGIAFSIFLLIAGVLEVIGTINFNDYFPLLNDYPFLNLPSLAIVLGGILNNVFIMYPALNVGKAWASFIYLFSQSRIRSKTLKKDVDMVIGWSKRIKQDKMKAYNEIQEENNKDLSGFLFSLVSTKYSNDDIRSFGENSIEEYYNRNLITVDTLTSMGTSAPAFGMFGTLFGLIIMLGQLDNPAQMGPGLAAALMTTLYGISLAHLFFFPLSRKLRNLAQIQRFREYLILEGVLMINENRSPFYIQDKLNSYLQRESNFSEESDDGFAKQAA